MATPAFIVRQLLDYDPETGVLLWKPRPAELFEGRRHSAQHLCDGFNTRYAGKPALTSSWRGYLSGNLFGKRLAAHRAAWVIYYGEWPKGQIDHINGDRADNRICNLREVDHRANSHNQRIPKSNTSGVIGVCLYRSRWRAVIKVDGVNHHLGMFDTIEQAIHARREGEAKHGFHPNHGRGR